MTALLALLVGSALAAEPRPEPLQQPDAAVLPSWREVYAELRELQQQVGGPVALAAPGKEARSLGRRVTALFAAGEVVLRPVPMVGEPQAELELAQQATGLRCVAWLSPASAGWTLQPLGECGAVQLAKEELPPPPLLRFVPKAGEPPYRVVDEQGRKVDPWRFATLTRDPELRTELISERRRRRFAARALEVGGALLFASAAVPLVTSLGAEEGVAEDRRFTALFLASTGAIAFAGGRLDRRGLEARQAEVGNYIHPVDAAASLEDYNDRAREQRGVRAQAAQVQTAEPDSTEPDSTEPDSTEPDSTEPDSTEPDSTEPDSTEPEEPTP